jgi:hypothetical protein
LPNRLNNLRRVAVRSKRNPGSTVEPIVLWLPKINSIR